MQIEINKNKRITCVCLIGSTDSSIKVDDFNFKYNHFNYKYLDDNIIYSPITNEAEKFIKKIYNEDTDLYSEGLTLSEQIEYYKKLIVEKTKEIESEKLAGFGNPNLELELNELKKIHLEKSHELALQIENRLKEV